ncbi:kinase-like domain-containing protein [Mycena epipterygia]|nr:kinase-like domain-containing protein [Mycena epipterygia]
MAISARRVTHACSVTDLTLTSTTTFPDEHADVLLASSKYPTVVGYELVQKIGGGGFSQLVQNSCHFKLRIFRAVNVQDHRVVACQVIVVTPETMDKECRTVDKEMRIHAGLKHVNILEFMDAVVVELKHRHHFFPGIYMLLELAAGGDLFDKIAPDIGVGDEVAHFCFNQLISGMDYIHKEGVCHRDLKPENLLLDATGTLEISGFGLSSVFKLKETGRARPLTDRCRSLPYAAPELNRDQPYEAEPIGVWGVGVILYTLLAGNTPWDKPTLRSPEFARYLSGEIFQEQPWIRFSSEALSNTFCRPSQLTEQGHASLAQALTQSLRTAGDLDLASPNFNQRNDSDQDEDEDKTLSPTIALVDSRYRQSHTQSGTRYTCTPHLTRFYAGFPPDQLLLFVRIGGHDARKEVFCG